jgi:hypothetical protein
MTNILIKFFVIIEKLWYHWVSYSILSSSVVEQSAVNRLAVGSSPTWGVINKIRDR